MKTYTIAPDMRTSWQGMGSIYIATFAILWLFVEPLGMLGLIPAFDKQSSVLMYLFLLVVPAISLPVFLRWHRWYKIHDLPFIELSIHSAIDGVTYKMRVAKNMQIAEFLHQYIEILRRGPARDRVNQILYRYYPVLQVKRNGKFIDIDGNMSLQAAGIKNQEECQVRAEVYKHMNQALFSRVGKT